MQQNNQASIVDKTVPVTVLLPKSIRNNIEQEFKYNQKNNLGFDSFSAVLAHRLVKGEKLEKPFIIRQKERLIKRNVTLPESLHAEITNEAKDNKVNLRAWTSFNAVLVRRLQHIKLFSIPE